MPKFKLDEVDHQILDILIDNTRTQKWLGTQKNQTLSIMAIK